MTERIPKREKRRMQNPHFYYFVHIQFFKFFALNFKIMGIVTRGHGGTRDEAYIKSQNQ